MLDHDAVLGQLGADGHVRAIFTLAEYLDDEEATSEAAGQGLQRGHSATDEHQTKLSNVERGLSYISHSNVVTIDEYSRTKLSDSASDFVAMTHCPRCPG